VSTEDILRDPAKILGEGLQDFDDRAREISALMILYRSMGLHDWVEGAKRKMKKVRQERQEARIGNVQSAFQAYLEEKAVHIVNRVGTRLKETEKGLRFCHVTKSTVCHIQGGCEHGK
jgi:predicted flavoprotein YhiN